MQNNPNVNQFVQPNNQNIKQQNGQNTNLPNVPLNKPKVEQNNY